MSQPQERKPGRPRPLARLRPPWRDLPRQGEMLAWTAVGFVAQWLVIVLSLVAAVRLVPEQVWAAGASLPLMLLTGVLCAVAAGRPRIRAVGYGILLALLAQIGLAILIAILIAAFSGLIISSY